MPQRGQIAWAQLRVGALVIVSLTIFALGIFLISGEVGFLARKYKIKAYFSDAGGLREGAQVRLAGIAVGNVDRILISPFPEAGRAVEVVMRIARTYQNQIRADSVAAITTVGLLGEGYVDISRGARTAQVIPDGGEVKSKEEADIKRIVQNTNDVIANLRVLSAKLNDVAEQIQSGRGSLGSLIYNENLYSRLNETAGSAQHVINRVERGEGTLGKIMADETLYQRTLATIDHLNQIVGDIQHGNGSLAKFISDPELYNNVTQMVSHANTLVDNVNKGQGTLGKLATDPQLYNRLNETLDRLDVVATRIEQGQGTIGKLSTDPTLYNNLSASSQALREFLTEFKKNPKKYLSVRVRLF